MSGWTPTSPPEIELALEEAPEQVLRRVLRELDIHYITLTIDETRDYEEAQRRELGDWIYHHRHDA